MIQSVHVTWAHGGSVTMHSTDPAVEHLEILRDANNVPVAVTVIYSNRQLTYTRFVSIDIGES